MTFDQELVRTALRHVRSPGGGSLADRVEWVTHSEGFAKIKLSDPALTSSEACEGAAAKVHEAVRAHASIKGLALRSLRVEFVDHSGSVVHTSARGENVPAEAQQALEAKAPAAASSKTDDAPASKKPNPQQSAGSLPNVKHIIAVGAGKGGVGKSTLSVNLAVALARRGHAVGLMDGDIYGPSLPTMLGLDALEMNVRANMIQPFMVHGIKSATIGKMVDADKPLIWRGPMAHGAFKQLAEQTEWGELDYLVIDLPPGTGDVPLTMAQLLTLSGAVIVCTPQRVAQDDAVRAIRMFQQLGVDVLGIAENMSYFVGDDGKEYDIFGRGGAEMMAQRMGLPFLGAIPINTALRANSDSGDPTKNFEAQTAGGPVIPAAFDALAQNLESQVAMASLKSGKSTPKLSIS